MTGSHGKSQNRQKNLIRPMAETGCGPDGRGLAACPLGNLLYAPTMMHEGRVRSSHDCGYGKQPLNTPDNAVNATPPSQLHQRGIIIPKCNTSPSPLGISHAESNDRFCEGHYTVLSPQREDSRSRQTSSILTFLLFFRRWYLPDPPKFEILVTSARAHHIARRADAAEQHARVVSVPDLCDAVQRWVCVDHDRVSWVSVGRQELFLVRRPVDGSNLGWRFQRMQPSARRTVPYVDGGVIRTPATSQKRWLPWAPRNRLQKAKDKLRWRTQLHGDDLP